MINPWGLIIYIWSFVFHHSYFNIYIWSFKFDHLYLMTLISTFIFDHLHFIICIWSFTLIIICIWSPADVFDCWALAILNRENVMRVASSRGLDICEYIWATLAKIKFLSFIKIRIWLINSRNIKGSSMQWSELQILGGM